MAKVLKQGNLFTKRFRALPDDRKEFEIQIQLVAMLRWCIKPGVIWRHVPNGEHRDKRTAAKLKAMGVLAGSADLEFFWNDDKSAVQPCTQVLFLELKRPGGMLSLAQVGFKQSVTYIGMGYACVSDVDTAIRLLGSCGLIKPGVEVCGRRWG